MQVVYKDNHIIIVYKESGEIVQGDKTGDVPLSETVKEYIKEKYHKPGNVFLGVVHRLDRPVAGLVVQQGAVSAQRDVPQRRGAQDLLGDHTKRTR